MKLARAIKAYKAERDPPLLGDIRPTRDYPAGTDFKEITEFEVWDGSQWVRSDDQPDYMVQQ